MIHDKEIALKIAENLLEIKAIRLSPAEPFTWASGIKSPIYCDNRLSLSHVEVRNYIRDSFVKLVLDRFPDAEWISGVATAGISHGALLADALQKPFNYVRSKPKGHGMQNLIEGEVGNGASTIVVEDLISTGGSSIKAVQALRESGHEVLGVVAIFNYGFAKAAANFDEISCPFYTLSDFTSLQEYAENNSMFGEEELSFIRDWRASMA